MTTYECKKLTEEKAWQAIKAGECNIGSSDLTSFFVYLFIMVGVIITLFGILASDRENVEK